MNMRSYRIVGLGWVVLLCVVAFPSVGQDVSSSPAPASPQENGAEEEQEKVLEPVPPSDITSRAAEVTLQLDEIKEQIAPSPAVVEFSLEVSRQAVPIAELSGELNELTAATVTARQLEDQRSKWRQTESQLDRWMSRVDARWKELQTTREQLQETKQQWQLTRDAESADELPEELTQRVEQIITRTDSLLTSTQQRIDQVAVIVEELTQAKQTTTTALERLNALAGDVTRRLMTRNVPPLWHTQSTEWFGLDDTTRKISRSWVQDFQAFAMDYWVRLFVHSVVFVILVIAAVAARRSSRTWPEEEELDRARFLVSRPYSVALVFAVLSCVFIYGALPAAGRDFFHLLILIPMLRLATGLATRTERIGLYGLVGLLGLHLMVHLCPENSLLQRVALLATQVSALLLVGYLIWRGRWRHGHELTWRRGTALAGCGIAMSLFAVALIANVLGWINLGQFLTESTILVSEGAVLGILFLRAGSALLPAVTRYGAGWAFLSVRHYPERFERTGRILLTLFLLVVWSRLALTRFRLRDPLLEQTDDLLAAPLSWTGLEITTGDLLQALLIMAAALVAQRLLRFFLQEEAFPRLHVPASSAAVFTTLTNYAVVAAGLLMAGSALGFTATQLTVLFGALGVGIGFGLQNIVNNFVSGLILIFERPIKVGDILESGGNWSVVKRIGVRATVLRTFEGAEIVVPNGDLVSKEVKNWTLTDAVNRVELLVGVAYGTNPREVLDVLGRVAGENELVLDEPKPLPLMIGFGDSSLNFRLLCWAKIEDRFEVVSRLHVDLCEALEEAGITIPFPQRDLHVRSVEVATADWKNMIADDS